MRIIYITLLFFSYNTLNAQVGIGTTNPSDAAMLEISSSSDNVNFRGFLLPRVPSQTERNLINSSIDDIGMLVFVASTGTFEAWNGINWETIYTFSTFPTVLVQQDFDTNTSWGYTNSPAFYAVGNDIYNVTSSLGTGDTSAIDLVRDNFLGCRDLNNTNGGGNFNHDIIFNNVDVSVLTNPRIAFDYDVFEFDNGDDLSYQIYHDDIGQGSVLLVEGSGDLSAQGTEIISIPPGVTLVRITVSVIQNGNDDFAGIDNFVIYGD